MIEDLTTVSQIGGGIFSQITRSERDVGPSVQKVRLFVCPCVSFTVWHLSSSFWLSPYEVLLDGSAGRGVDGGGGRCRGTSRGQPLLSVSLWNNTCFSI